MLKRARRAAPYLPGVLGAGLVAFGAGLMYLPLLPVVAGAFLLYLDGRLPVPGGRKR